MTGTMDESTEVKTAGEYVAEQVAQGLKPTRIELHFGETQLDSEQARRVLSIGKEALDLFRQKNRGYGGDNAGVLGEKGQFADIWRKVGKLKHTLWDGGEVVGESIEEMLFDLIGHCLLTIDFLREKRQSSSILSDGSIRDLDVGQGTYLANAFGRHAR